MPRLHTAALPTAPTPAGAVPSLLRSLLLDDSEMGCVHGFSNRHGGFSQGAFASLNLSTQVGDQPALVLQNRARALQALGRPHAKWLGLRQVHGSHSVAVTRHVETDTIQADALWSRDADVVLAILSADCVPILMAAPAGGVVAAVHAGWRGTCLHIAAAMVQRLHALQLPPAQLRVVLGPAIGPCCFAIGPEVQDALSRAASAVGCAPDDFLRRANGQVYADLWQLNRCTLLQAGVLLEHLEVRRVCTACDSAYFSHRRDAQPPAGTPPDLLKPLRCGRQAALIGLTASPGTGRRGIS